MYISKRIVVFNDFTHSLSAEIIAPIADSYKNTSVNKTFTC